MEENIEMKVGKDVPEVKKEPRPTCEFNVMSTYSKLEVLNTFSADLRFNLDLCCYKYPLLTCL